MERRNDPDPRLGAEWTLILGLAVFFYVLLDGFDLGVGMLFGLAPETRSRNAMIGSIAPVWDGNETWLILGGLGLFSAFPRAFSIIIPAVYIPLTVIRFGLIFRGLAFRSRDSANVTFWTARSPGSVIATFAQGWWSAPSSKVFASTAGNSLVRPSMS